MKTKWIKWLVFALLAGAALWAAYRTFGSKRDEPLRFETVKAQRGRIAAKVTASGVLSALVTVQVGSQVSGRIETLRVDYGSRVKKGDVIATIDARIFKAALAQARANRASAQANLDRAHVEEEDARRQLARAKVLAAKKLISQAETDSAEAKAEAAKAQVRVAEASLAQTGAAIEQAQLNLTFTTIFSPIDGVVISRAVDAGQTVAASFQSPTLFTIAQDLAKMQVDTNVSEADVGRVRQGMNVTFKVDAYPERDFKGAVRQVRDAAQTVQGVVTYDAVVDVDNAELLLKPGMTANVTFVYAERENVLRIPNAALRYRPDTAALALLDNVHGPQANAPVEIPKLKPGEKAVWFLKDGRPAPKVVRVGLSDGSFTEVVEGTVKQGEVLISEMIVDPARAPMKKMF